MVSVATPIAAIFALSSLDFVSAFPSYRLKIPNAFRVPCPPGAEGCSTAEPTVRLDGNLTGGETCNCDAIGHNTCKGATFPLNPFGSAFRAAGFKWTKQLCEADSDGDGLTNGEELGDPCCLWEAGDGFSEYTRNFVPMHPGVKNSAADKASYTRPSCGVTSPTFKSPKMNTFNEGEVQKTMDLYVANYTIPAVATTYVHFKWNFDDDSADIFHITYAEVILRNPRYLHHYVLYGCKDKWPANEVGQVWPMVGFSSPCPNMVGEWAPGKDVIASPAFLGVPVGRGANVNAFLVQVHFTNAEKVAGVVSTDGMRLFYTPTLRSQSQLTFDMSRLSVNSNIAVPPNKTRWFATRSCNVSLQKTNPTAPDSFNIALIWFHGHLLSREMYLVLRKKDGRVYDLGSDRHWSFDDQYTRNVMAMNMTLEPGDRLESTCVYDSRRESRYTYFGIETTDEMCWAGVRGWPSSVLPRCTGAFWFGELNGTEAGQLTQQRHPLTEAKYALDGRNPLNGGLLLKESFAGMTPLSSAAWTVEPPSPFACQAPPALASGRETSGASPSFGGPLWPATVATLVLGAVWASAASSRV